ncbi:acetate--CoA ligase family protein [Bordetella genomosp. 4]|uniref:ATP-grasp domain-containing protein n=1 Tax=Bordetella genomosp. 4 TaxID=463044 RepID=A0A261TYR9_9BORD|nr:acetate--CoA ligase family protein [Bordetella genomosp. 4]OZI54417.1 hypothetical protein CAL20_18220 [Bordetella genomosp. 4]
MTAIAHPLQCFFDPTSVAIIGASSDPDKLGGRPIRFLREAGYEGKIFPINPRYDTVQGLKAYPSLNDVPDPIDHAVIIVPATGAHDALQACIEKGIRHVQILSSGFAEDGPAGQVLQDALVALAARHGVRLLGPNCLGIVSTSNRFYATFSTALEALSPRPGGISFATQSGAFGSCAYAQAIQRNLGISRIVATGNEADVDVAQCIDFLASDPATHIICAAIEGCRDGDMLRQALLKAAAANKPVILMKVGTSSRGQLAAATHTGAVAGNDRIFDAVIRECGAYRANTIEQMLDIAYLCTHLPLPANAQAGILTVSGGIGVLMTDDAERHGIDIPSIPPALQNRIHGLVPFAIGDNPLDTTAQVGAVKQGIPGLAEMLLQDTDWSILCVYLAQIPCDERRFPDMLESLGKLRRDYPDKLIVLVGPHSEKMRAEIEARHLVIFADPGRAMAALGGLVALVERRRHLVRHQETTDRTPIVAAPAVGTQLDEAQAKHILAQYGLPMLRETLCTTAEQAVQAANTIGFPVVAKIVSPDILHKTEMGGVLLDLPDEQAVRDAYATLQQRAASVPGNPHISGVLISPMSKGGTETILGVHVDPWFGPMVMFGLGGVSVELFKDVAFASAPLTPARALALIQSVQAFKLLNGWRGKPALDVSKLVDALVALSHLAHDWRAVLSGVDINPFIARQDGAVCLDALITLKNAAPA